MNKAVFYTDKDCETPSSRIRLGVLNFMETKMNIKTLMRYVWIAVLCCAASLPMHAQSATDGAIGGTVVDTADLAIPNATIKIR